MYVNYHGINTKSIKSKISLLKQITVTGKQNSKNNKGVQLQM